MYRRIPIQDLRRLVDGAVLLASYVVVISVCAALALLAFAQAGRVGMVVAKQSAAEYWDGPKASEPRVRSAVLNDGITFRYLSKREQPTAQAAKPPLKGVRTGLLKSAPEQQFTPWGFWNWNQPEPAQPVQPLIPETYRTVCVRLCDGAFFPISFSTPSDRFARDEKLCQSQCGSPAKLYVYRNPGGDPEQMRDLNGEPYTKLETAFRYKTSYDAACTCKAQPWETASIDKHRQYAMLETQAKTDKKAADELKKLQASPVKMGRKATAKLVLPGQQPGAAPVAVVRSFNGQKVTIISGGPQNAAALPVADKAVKPKSLTNVPAFKPAFAAAPPAPSEPKGKRGKSAGKVARAYNGDDWRLNVFQSN